MRRIRQQLDAEAVSRILYEGKYGVWGVAGDEGYPYAVPVNYAYDGEAIYIHSALMGHKIDAIRREPKCSFCIVDKDDVVPEEFTSYFRSVIVFGRAVIVEDPEERVRALRLLGEKYSPGIDPTAEIERFIRAVAIIRIDIDQVTGKQAKELVK